MFWCQGRACDRSVYERLILLHGRSDTISSSLPASLHASAECADADTQIAVSRTTAPSADFAARYPLAASIRDGRRADQFQPTRRPAFGCIVSQSWPSSRLCVAHRASKVFSQHFLKRRHIHHLLGQHLPQLGVLGLKRLQLLGVRHFHAALLGSPLVECRITDTVLAAKLLRPKPSLMLFHYPDYLFFAETASLHPLSPQLENRRTSNAEHFRGAGQSAIPLPDRREKRHNRPGDRALIGVLKNRKRLGSMDIQDSHWS